MDYLFTYMDCVHLYTNTDYLHADIRLHTNTDYLYPDCGAQTNFVQDKKKLYEYGLFISGLQRTDIFCTQDKNSGT